MTRSAAWWFLMFLAGAAPVRLAGQDLAALAREQAQLEERLGAARGLMERLLAGFRAEGREATVQLLEKGLQFLEASQLQATLSDARRGLQDGRVHEASTRQAQAAEKLEALLSLLLNRLDTAELEQTVQELQKNFEALQGLTREQGRIRSEASEAVERSRDPAEQSLARGLAELAEKQRRLAAQTAKLQPEGSAALEAVLERLRRLARTLGSVDRNLEPQAPGRALLQELERLRSKQASLEEQTFRAAGASHDLAGRLADLARRAGSLSSTGAEREAEAARLAEEAARLAGTPGAPREIKDALAELGRMAGNPAAAAAAKELLEKAAERAGQDAARRAEAAAAEHERLASELEQAAARADSLSPEAASALRQAAAAAKSAGATPESGSARAAAEETFQALMRARTALQDAGADPARSLRSARSEAEMAIRELKQAQGPETAVDKLEQAAQELDAAAGQAEAPDPSPARAGARTARDRVDEALQELTGRLAGQDAGQEQAVAQAGSDQARLSEEAGKLGRELDQASTAGKISPLQQEGGQAGLDAARRSMDQAREELLENRLDAARRSQEQAARDLERAREALERGHRPSPQAAEELKRLAREEAELREKILELARRLEPGRDARAAAALEEAARLAQEASRGMEEGDPGESEDKAEAAEEKLREAERELAEKRNRYLNLRQEELLFRITEELTDLLTRHKAVQQETLALDEQVRRGGGRLTRFLRGRIEAQGHAERDLAGKCRFLRENVEAEESLVFSAALRGIEADLEAIARLLTGREPDPGSRVQGLQEDVTRAAERLLQATRQELRRKKEDQGRQRQPQETNQAPPKPKLVPDLAELKLLKAMQEDLLARTRSLVQETAIPGAETLFRAVLERHAHQQAELKDLFERFTARLRPPAEQGPARESGKEDGR